MEQAHEQVDGVITAGQHAPDGRAGVARALRYLADEIEGGRAVADVDFNIDTVMRARPRGWQDAMKPPEYEQQTYGVRWRVAVATLGEPPAWMAGGERELCRMEQGQTTEPAGAKICKFCGGTHPSPDLLTDEDLRKVATMMIGGSIAWSPVCQPSIALAHGVLRLLACRE